MKLTRFEAMPNDTTNIDCDFRDGKNCKISAELAGLDEILCASDAACNICSNNQNPRSRNKVTMDLAVHALRSSGRIEDSRKLIESASDIYNKNSMLEEIIRGTGTGSHLWKLLDEINVKHKPNCRCLALAKKMNEWGPDGCREHRQEIIEDMKENSKEYGWGDVAKAAVSTMKTGLVWRINPFDVYGSLVDEAIRRSESV